MKIGFIGAGAMGRPMVERLVATGQEVTVLVRSDEAQQAAEASGVHWARSVRDTVADADLVIDVVLTDAQVREVFLGPDGAIEAMKPGATLIQHTTSDPETARLLGEAGAARGVRVLDAALSGGPPDIQAGRLTLWVGGEEAVLDEVRPVLAAYASPITHVGPLGNGQRVKLVNNALFISHVGLAVQAVKVAESLGISEAAILAGVQQGSGASRGLSIVAGMGSVAAVADRLSGLMFKDYTVVREVARRAGADLGVIEDVLTSDTVQVDVLGQAPRAR
jgi:3-hydroxyisobutyrate dehydrogenase-like beta-hydroxyacid dehydrogenase